MRLSFGFNYNDGMTENKVNSKRKKTKNKSSYQWITIMSLVHYILTFV